MLFTVQTAKDYMRKTKILTTLHSTRELYLTNLIVFTHIINFTFYIFELRVWLGLGQLSMLI